MKKRRLVVAAFLLCATLLMGIGYAAISGQLTINGTATYNGTGEVGSDIHTAVKFTNATAMTNCTAAITDTATGNVANMIVTFNDTEGVAGTEFTATAKYTVAYETEDQTLPKIVFEAPVPQLTGDSNFSVAVDWNGNTEIAPGGEAVMTVTVTYVVPSTPETGSVVASVVIPMPYATVAPATTQP